MFLFSKPKNDNLTAENINQSKKCIAAENSNSLKKL